jgi:hypothetical protein
MHIKKLFVELKRRKQVENLAVSVELNRQNYFLYAIETNQLFGSYFSYPNEFFLS